jgi:hypothetical protein
MPSTRLSLAALGLVACSAPSFPEDSSATSSDGGQPPTGGMTSTTGGTTSLSGGAPTGGAPTGGASTGGAAIGGMGIGGAEGGMGTGGAAEVECMGIAITDGMLDECDAPGGFDPVDQNVTHCTADSSVYWPVKIYEVQVAAGDCVWMRADNAGSPSGADLFGAIVDPGGKSLLFDEEADCTVPNPDDYLCPEGGTTIASSGTAYIVVGSWEGDGCPPDTDTPFQVGVAVNGVDVTGLAELCSGDLQVLIP